MVVWISDNVDENKRDHHENVLQRAFNTKTIIFDHLFGAVRVHIQYFSAIINQCTKSGSFFSLDTECLSKCHNFVCVFMI